jgi:hypothetical protein
MIVLSLCPWQRRRRQQKKTIQPMGSGFLHGPCSKARTASEHGDNSPRWSPKFFALPGIGGFGPGAEEAGASQEKGRRRQHSYQHQDRPIFPATMTSCSLPFRRGGRFIIPICDALIHLRVQKSTVKKSANAVLKVHHDSVVHLINTYDLHIHLCILGLNSQPFFCDVSPMQYRCKTL